MPFKDIPFQNHQLAKFFHWQTQERYVAPLICFGFGMGVLGVVMSKRTVEDTWYGQLWADYDLPLLMGTPFVLLGILMWKASDNALRASEENAGIIRGKAREIKK